MIRPVLRMGDPRLLERAEPVTAFDTPDLHALIADMRELSPTLRDRWSAAGLSHMLSVSGLHVGLIAVAVTLVAQVVGLARNAAAAFVVTIASLFAIMAFGLPSLMAALGHCEGHKCGDVVQTYTGPLTVAEAGVQIALIPIAAVIGLVAFIGLAL